MCAHCRRREMAGALLLLVHAALFAFGPPPVVFLARHDHVVVGAVTAEQWRAHVEAHLRQAGSHYLSAGISRLPVPPDQPRITVLPGCAYDALGLSARALAAAPLIAPAGESALATTGRVETPFVVDRSPDLMPTPPPPRLLSQRLILRDAPAASFRFV